MEWNHSYHTTCVIHVLIIILLVFNKSNNILTAAMCNGVSPSLFCMLITEGIFFNNLRASSKLRLVAMCRGVSPFLSALRAYTNPVKQCNINKTHTIPLSHTQIALFPFPKSKLNVGRSRLAGVELAIKK